VEKFVKDKKYNIMKKVRISATIPEEIFEKFEEFSKNAGFKTRSKAISMALHEYVVANKWMEQKESIAGAIVITYFHHSNINEILVSIQHEYNEVINASMHIHLNKEQCLEIIAVNGEAKKIKKLYEKLQGIRGIVAAKMVTAA